MATDAADAEVAVELRRRGWDQGSLFRAPSAPVSRLKFDPIPLAGSGEWQVEYDTLGDDEYFVVVSQVCDLLKAPSAEPSVDVMVATWTSDSAIIHGARRNSYRYFILDSRTLADGREQALIVDADRRTRLEKRSLLSMHRETTLAAGDVKAPREFRPWLIARAGRQPLPDELVEAVQRPLVTAIRKLKSGHKHRRILDQINFVLCFAAETEGDCMLVELLLVCDESGPEPSISVEDAAEIGGWFEAIIGKVGKAKLQDCKPYTMDMISARAFVHAYEIALGEFSLVPPDPTEENSEGHAAEAAAKVVPAGSAKREKNKKQVQSQ